MEKVERANADFEEDELNQFAENEDVLEDLGGAVRSPVHGGER